MPKYNLQDCDELERKYPSNYRRPPLKERLSVPDGYWVKLPFITRWRDTPILEWLAVQVTSKDPMTSTYYGKLGDHPEHTQGVKINDEIEFQAKHIGQIILPE